MVLRQIEPLIFVIRGKPDNCQRTVAIVLTGTSLFCFGVLLSGFFGGGGRGDFSQAARGIEDDT